MQAQWRNRVCSSLFQFGNKNSNKSQIRLENSFQEILCLMLNNMIDVWINNGSGWNVESIESQYNNISTYRLLSGSFYMDLPVELKSPNQH